MTKEITLIEIVCRIVNIFYTKVVFRSTYKQSYSIINCIWLYLPNYHTIILSVIRSEYTTIDENGI